MKLDWLLKKFSKPIKQERIVDPLTQAHIRFINKRRREQALREYNTFKGT